MQADDPKPDFRHIRAATAKANGEFLIESFVQIGDDLYQLAKGELSDREAAPNAGVVWLLWKDDKKRAMHVVSRSKSEGRCSCGAFKFRSGRCKHLRALIALQLLPATDR